MSLFADILVLAALVAAAWLGARRGLLKSLAGLLIVLVALWGASWAADHLAEPVAQWIEPRVTQRVERKLEESHAADAGQMLQAFSFRGSGLQKMLDAVHQRVQQPARPSSGLWPRASPVPWRGRRCMWWCS